MLRIFHKKPAISTDAELLEQYRQTGTLDQLGVLYERYMELVYGVCLKYLKDTGKAEDAVIAIFEELVKKVKKHEIKNFRSWLHVLTKNHCLMYLRKENKKSFKVHYDSEFMQTMDLPHPIDEPIEAQEMRLAALKICIAKLPPQQKRCVELFYYQNRSYKEIAEMTDQQVNKVRSYIQNGRRNLKNCINTNTTK